MIEEQEQEEYNPSKEENTLHEIELNSEDWKIAEFHLKSSISSEIRIEKIISVKNTITFNQFKFLTKSHLWTYGWYSLKGDNYEEEMKQMREKTFAIPKIGANFKVGAIFDGTNNSEVQSVYVLCNIIIGKSFCKIKQEGERETPPVQVDYPYDCYMYCSPESSAKSQKMSWSMTKPYSYYIRNIKYIEPLYCVFFSHVDTYITNLQSKYMCSECKTKEAETYCPDCVNYYCKNCQSLIHYGNVTDTKIKEIFKHGDSVPVLYTTRPGKCSIHRQRDSEYYCDICKIAICGYCRFKGSHSKGTQSLHQPEDIYIEWKKADSHIQEYDEKKKNGISISRKINEQIKSCQDKISEHNKEITSTYDDLKNEIQLQSSETKYKVFQYIAALREIKRNLLYYHKYFIEREQYLQEQGNQPELAFIWSMHQDIIFELLENFEEMKKKDLTQIKNCIKMPKVRVDVSHVNFENFFKKKEQTEISSKRNIQKNGEFETKQKEQNYDNIDNTSKAIILIEICLFY